MSLPRAPSKYDANDQDRLRLELDARDRNSRKANQDVTVAGGARLLLYSPDGTAWSVEVDDAGALSSVAA